MRMTGLEWRYLQRIALDHPYFDTHGLPLTEKEAKAIVKANIGMTGKEFVDSIYANLGMTRPEEKKDRFAWLRSIGELFTVPPIRKIAIAVLVVILMTVFFAATPTGRAIAESVIQYIATLFEDGRVIVNQKDSKVIITPVYTMPDHEENETQEDGSFTVHVKTFEDFTAVKGVHPTVLSLPYTELYYDYSESKEYLMLHAKYETPRGMIITYQIWNMMDFVTTTSAEFSVYDADPTVYYSYEENGTTTVMKLYEDSVLEIIFKDCYTVDEILSLLMDE